MTDNATEDELQKPPSPKRTHSTGSHKSHHSHHHHDGQSHGYWDNWQTRAGTISLFLSLLMQLSYVAFPAYNFSLAIWATVHPFAHRHNTKGTMLFVSILIISCVTDVIWSSLWISGTAFYDMLCASEKIGILHCDGLQSFPGCGTNRFVTVLFITNIGVKIWTAVSIWKAVAVAIKQPEPIVHAVEIPPSDSIPDAHPSAIPVEPSTT